MKIYQKVQINFPCGYKVLARRSIIMGLLTAFMIKDEYYTKRDYNNWVK